MAQETQQDPQKPTQDQPPPKQHAPQRPRQPGDPGPDQSAPKLPEYVQSSEGDDEAQRAAEEGPGYDEDASIKGSPGPDSNSSPNSPSRSR